MKKLSAKKVKNSDTLNIPLMNEPLRALLQLALTSVLDTDDVFHTLRTHTT